MRATKSALFFVMGFVGCIMAQPALASVCSADICITKTLTGVGPAFTHYSPGYSFDNGYYSVAETIVNDSGVAWTDYHLTLQIFNPTSDDWIDSPGFDLIFFDPSSDISVGVNGLDQDPAGWSVVVGDIPIDTLDFFFITFAIAHGDILTLNYAVGDFGDFEWRLAQYATTTPVPVPGAALLFGSAIAAFAAYRRRG